MTPLCCPQDHIEPVLLAHLRHSVAGCGNDDPSVPSGGAALVRPDGHVTAIVPHPTDLPAALTALLDRAPSTWRAAA